MALSDVIRSAVATAKTATAGLRVTVTHNQWTAVDKYGDDTLATTTSRSGILEYRTKVMRGADGVDRVARARLTLLENVSVDARDTFTLPDGVTSKVVGVEGIADPDTAGNVYLTEVWLG